MSCGNRYLEVTCDARNSFRRRYTMDCAAATQIDVWEDCVKRAVQCAGGSSEEEGDSSLDGSNSSASSLVVLCQVHSQLLQCLCQEHDDFLIQTTGEHLRWRLSIEEMSRDLRRRVSVEADLYRAIIGLSMLILEKLPLNFRDAGSKESVLQRTIQQCVLLLKLLSSVYAFCMDQQELPSTSYPILEEWTEQQQESYANEGNDMNMISFDREALAAEDDALVQMASTPIPFESAYIGGSDSCAEMENLPLEARMTSSEGASSSSISILLDDKGIIRARESSATWWALTAYSTTRYQSQGLSIDSVATNSDMSQSSPSKYLTRCIITLEVGRDGHKWWECTSRIIQALREIRELQDEVASLWAPEETLARISEAREEATV